MAGHCIQCGSDLSASGDIRFYCDSCRPWRLANSGAATRPPARMAGASNHAKPPRKPPAPQAARSQKSRPSHGLPAVRRSRLVKRSSSRPAKKSLREILAPLDRGGSMVTRGTPRTTGRVCCICRIYAPMANSDRCYQCNPE